MKLSSSQPPSVSQSTSWSSEEEQEPTEIVIDESPSRLPPGYVPIDPLKREAKDFPTLAGILSLQLFFWYVYKRIIWITILVGLLGALILYKSPPEESLKLSDADLLSEIHNIKASINTTYFDLLVAQKEVYSLTSSYWFASLRPSLRRIRSDAWAEKVTPLETKLVQLEMKYDELHRVQQSRHGIFSSSCFRETLTLCKNAFKVALQQGLYSIFTTEVRIGYYYPELNMFETRSRYNFFYTINLSSDSSDEDHGVPFLILALVLIAIMMIVANLWLAFHLLPLLLSYGCSSLLLNIVPICIVFFLTTLGMWLAIGNLGASFFGVICLLSKLRNKKNK